MSSVPSLLACFFGGAFLANAVPHLGNGISGRRFPTVFNRDSSPTLNVVWGAINLALAYGLLIWVADLGLKQVVPVAVASAGGILLALRLSTRFPELIARVKAAQEKSSGSAG